MAELTENPFEQINDDGSIKGGSDPFGNGGATPWPYAKGQETSANPFDFVNDDGTVRPGGTFQADTIGPFPPAPPQSSMLGAFGTHAAMGAVPAAGTLAGGEAGFLTGAAIGSIFPGPGTAIGGIVGGLAGALGGGFGAGMAQDYTLTKLAPEFKDGLDKTLATQEEQHPYASFVGGLAPYALTMSPTGLAKGAALPASATAWQRLAANPLTARAFSGAVQGGMELGNEYVQGQSPDWGKVALSTGFGIMFTRPNAIGAKVNGIGAAAVSPFLDTARIRRSLSGAEHPVSPGSEVAPEPVIPTLAEVDDANILGAGVTEDVFNGTHVRDEQSATTARENVLTEKSYLGPEAAPQDINDIAKSLNPDLVDRWETMNSQVDDLRNWIDEQNAPSDETISGLNTRKAELEAQIAQTKNKDEQRRLRTILRTEVQSQIDDFKTRSNAYLTGEALPDTPEMTQARLKIVELQNEIGRMAPERNALLRLAAERGRTETVPAAPIPSPESEGLPVNQTAPDGQSLSPEDRAKQATAALQAAEQVAGEQQAAGKSPLPQRPLAEQRAYIADDVRKQLIAAGRPADEAEAAAQIIAARYIARAARMNGVLGSAEDLYRIDGATIQAAKNPEPTPATPAVTVAAPAPSYDVVRAKAESYGAVNPLKLVERLIKSGQTNDDISNVIGRKLSANEVEAVRQQIGSPEAKQVETVGAPALPQGEVTRQALAEYLRNGGTISGAGRDLMQEHRGSISVAPGRKPIIKLFETADASSFLHESGHQWLEELARDSHHEMATDQLKADWQIVRTWVGAKDGKPITRAQHEKFARGFEQYMRAGIAPSKDLAGVFAQFRNWLVSIYRSVSSLGREISPEIREVYDRLLTTGERDTLVVPETARQPSMSDIHAVDARETPPAKAEPAMARIETEIEEAAADLTPGVRDEIANIRSRIESAETATAEPSTNVLGGEAGTGQAGAGRSEEGVPASGDLGTGQPRGAEPEPVVGSRGNAGGEGAETPAEPGRGGSTGAGEPANGGGSAAVRGAASRSPVPAPRPADALPEPESKFVDKAGNIRLDNIRALVADDAAAGGVKLENLKQVFRDIAKANGEFTNDRRGVISDESALGAAYALLGEDPTFFFRKQIGEAFSNSEAIGLQILASQSARNVAELARLAGTGTDDDVARYIQAREFHTVLQARYSQATAEAGRALRAFRKINELWSPEATAANAVMTRSMMEGRAKTLYQARIEAKLLSEMKDGKQVAKFINDRRMNPGEMLLEYWTSGLLSGPTTQTTIAISNTILSLMKALPETAIAAGTGKLRQAFGRQEAGVAAGETGARFRAAAAALPTALRESVRTLRTGGAVQLPGETPEGMPYFNPLTSRTLEEGATMKDVRSEAFGLLQGMRDGFIAGTALLNAGGVKDAPFLAAIRSGEGVIPDIKVGPAVIPLGTAIRLPFRLNAVQDSFFRTLNYSMEKAAEAYRMASNEGLSGDALTRRTTELWNKPTTDMMQRASEGSTALTLMGQAGEFTQKLQRLVNHSFNLPGLGPTRLLKFVNPFVRIASVTLDATLMERTPLGFMKSQIRDDLLGRNGAAAQDLATGRMVFGSAVLLTMGSLAAQGYVTGSEPSDPSEAAMWRLAGNQAYSIRIGDFWYSVNRLGPLGMLTGMSADLWHVADKADQGDFGSAASSMWHAVSANVLEQSWMTGFSDMLRATTDSGRYGEAYVRNFLSSFVPYSVGMGQLARALDPDTRRAKTVVDAVIAKTPFASQDLMPRRDIWGEPIPSRDALGAPGVTAIYTQKVGSDPVNLAMLNLGIHPAPVSPRIRNVELSPEQYDDYARIAGRMAKMRLDAIVRSPTFLSWPAQTRYTVLQESIRQSRETAAGIVMMRYPKIITDAYNLKMGRGLNPIAQ